MSDPTALSLLPTPQPAYILRGHATSVQALTFYALNTRLVSGDSAGFVVVWSLLTKRPVAVWRAHEDAVVVVNVVTAVAGVDPGSDAAAAAGQAAKSVTLLTQGRDRRVCVWNFSEDDDGGWSTVLPADNEIGGGTARRVPWLRHVLRVESVGFCAFSVCSAPSTRTRVTSSKRGEDDDEGVGSADEEGGDALLVALPGEESSTITLIHLPSEKQIGSIPAPQASNAKYGMLMALRLALDSSARILVIAGYESGRVCAFRSSPRGHSSTVPRTATDGSHAQGTGATAATGAFEIIYSHLSHTQPALSLDLTPDLSAFFSSGADSLLVKHPLPADTATTAAAAAEDVVVDEEIIKQEPLRSSRTGHSGQQSLVVRSDGKVVATAGWDSRVRLYSAKTLRELAVLKYHREGCHAVAFGQIRAPIPGAGRAAEQTAAALPGHLAAGLVSTRDAGGQVSVSQARQAKVTDTHWVAAGSKDGKISLWDIY